jgi:hypothetical protein
MTKPTRSLLAALAAAAVLLPLSSAAAVTSTPVPAKPDTFQQPKAGAWQVKDSFGEEDGSFTVKAGRNGKPPKVTKVHFGVIEQSNGYECPAVGARVDVMGSFKLLKATKYGNGNAGSPWTIAKDAKYDDDFPNMLGMKPVSVTLQIGAETRSGQLAMAFHQSKPSKPHEVAVQLRLLPPGFSTLDEGWCLYDLEGKPGK